MRCCAAVWVGCGLDGARIGDDLVYRQSMVSIHSSGLKKGNGLPMAGLGGATAILGSAISLLASNFIT